MLSQSEITVLREAKENGTLLLGKSRWAKGEQFCTVYHVVLSRGGSLGDLEIIRQAHEDVREWAGYKTDMEYSRVTDSEWEKRLTELLGEEFEESLGDA